MKFLNLKTEHDLVLVVAWILAALRDKGPYPILKIWGQEGSAKSTTVDFLRALIDPYRASKRSFPRDDRDLYVGAKNSHVLSYDNISTIPEWLSNSLCRLATGGAFATRVLYTDDDEQLFEATRPIILNGVDNFIMRFDLADRSIVLEQQLIPQRRRRLEDELKAEFAAEQPRILGLLFDLMSHGIRELPNTKSEVWPRMADFAQWATACCSMVWEDGVFKDAYNQNRQRSTRSAIEDDPVATELVNLVNEEQPEWKGTTSGLLAVLSTMVGEKVAKSKRWPTEPRELTSRLEKARASLRRVGITMRRPDKRTRKGRVWIIRYTDGSVKKNSANDRHNRHTRHKPNKHAGFGCDGPCDGVCVGADNDVE